MNGCHYTVICFISFSLHLAGRSHKLETFKYESNTLTTRQWSAPDNQKPESDSRSQIQSTVHIKYRHFVYKIKKVKNVKINKSERTYVYIAWHRQRLWPVARQTDPSSRQGGRRMTNKIPTALTTSKIWPWILERVMPRRTDWPTDRLSPVK